MGQVEPIDNNTSGQSWLNMGIRYIITLGLHAEYDSFDLAGQLITYVTFHFIGQCGLSR